MSDKTSELQPQNSHQSINNTGIQISQASYAGPLPPASEFEKYNSVLPNAGDRILSMAENEALNRHKMNEMLIKLESRDSLLGMLFAFILSIIFLCVGTYIILHSSSNVASIIAGAIFGISGIVGVIKSLIENRKKA